MMRRMRVYTVLRFLDIIVRIFYASTSEGRGPGDICELHWIVMWVRKKEGVINFSKTTSTVKVAVALGKNKLQKLQSIKIHSFSRLPDTTGIYPEEKFGPLPAASSSQISTSTAHGEHLPGPPTLTYYDTSQLTVVDKQVWLLYPLVDTRRRATFERTEARNGSQLKARTRGVGLFRLLSAPTYLHVPQRTFARTSVATTCECYP